MSVAGRQSSTDWSSATYCFHLRLRPHFVACSACAYQRRVPLLPAIWQEFRAGNLTRAARDVLLTLHGYRSTGGIAWPSHATLAGRCECSVRTVQRALLAGKTLRVGCLDAAPPDGRRALVPVQ